MLVKSLVVLIGICLFQLALLGIQSPDDPLFLFISNNALVVLTRLALLSILINIVFKNKFTYKASQLGTRASGLFLTAAGFLGATSQTVTDEFGGYIKALDFLLLIGIGLMFTMVSYSYKSGFQALDLKRMFPRISLAVKPAPEMPKLRTSSRTASAKGT